MPTPVPPPTSFADVWAVAERIGGWLTRDQARRLFDAVRALPPGATVVEIGSHQGRSTVVLAAARTDVGVVAVDPFVEGWKFGGAATRRLLEEHLATAGVADRVDLRVSTSRDVLRSWHGELQLVYVDGKHDVVSALSDLRWARHLPLGGRLLLHDAFSSVGVTLAVLLRVLPARRLRYVGRTGSLVELEVATPAPGDRLALLASLPWWLRNVLVKVTLRLRWRRGAALLGHHDRWDPY